jgi:hypothetical protein
MLAYASSPRLLKGPGDDKHGQVHLLSKQYPNDLAGVHGRWISNASSWVSRDMPNSFCWSYMMPRLFNNQMLSMVK